MGAGIAGAFLVVHDAGVALGGNILDQRSTEGDIQDLNAAADREHGRPARLRFLDERGFGRIAREVHSAYFFVTLLSVARGVDVFSTGKDEPGDGIENCCRRVSAREWRNYQWYEPCIFEGGHVSGGQPDTTGIAIWADASGNS